jgi:S1-C subfamily serine protease
MVMPPGYMDPTEAIFPVLGWRPDGDKPPEFRGTGFIVGDGSIAVTADHVVDWDGPLHFPAQSNPDTLFSLEVIERDFRHDLALLRVDPEYRLESAQPLVIPPEPFFVSNIGQFACVEYGNTSLEGSLIRLSAAVQIGNITRTFDATDRLRRPAGEDALELSFPAPRGASGAPVICLDGSRRVVGVVIGNVSHDLLPIEVETSLNAENTLLVETKYLLPRGLAVNVRHLQPLYQRHVAPE